MAVLLGLGLEVLEDLPRLGDVGTGGERVSEEYPRHGVRALGLVPCFHERFAEGLSVTVGAPDDDDTLPCLHGDCARVVAVDGGAHELAHGLKVDHVQPTVTLFPLGRHPHVTSRVALALAGSFTHPRRDPEYVFFGHVADGARSLRVLGEDHVVGGVALHVDDGDLVAVGAGQVGEVLKLLQLRVGRVEEHVAALLEARP